MTNPSDHGPAAPRAGNRRDFLRRLTGVALVGGAAAGGASIPAAAPGLAVRWRDGWLFDRLAGRRPVQAPGVSAWEHEGGLRIGAREPQLELNETAAWIWRACDGRRSVDAICSELAREAGESLGRVRGDVARTLRSLRRLGWITFA